MDAETLHFTLLEGSKILLIFGVPMIVAVVVVAAVIGFVQAATNLHEPVLGYAGRILAIFACGYVFAASLAEALKELLVGVLR